MNGINAISNQLNANNQPQKAESRSVNNTGVNFTNVFELVRRSIDGIMVVAEGNRAGDLSFEKNKLEIEKKREFKTDLEEANEILYKIAKIMEKQGKAK